MRCVYTRDGFYGFCQTHSFLCNLYDSSTRFGCVVAMVGGGLNLLAVASRRVNSLNASAWICERYNSVLCCVVYVRRRTQSLALLCV